MSLRVTIEQLNPRMREQAREKLEALGGTVRRHICRDDPTQFDKDGAKRQMKRPRATGEKLEKKRACARDYARRMLQTPASEILARQLEDGGIAFLREHRFHPVRKWRFDYAIIVGKIAVEVDGGIWTQGRHTRGSGYERDMVKLNAAVLLGWRVFRFSPRMVRVGEAMRILREALLTNTLSGQGYGGGEAYPVASERVPRRSKEKAKSDKE